MQSEIQPVEVSVVTSFFGTASTVNSFVPAVAEAIEALTQNYELILVDDGGPESTWNDIVVQAANRPQIKALRLSRNFGQHAAIRAGLNVAKGEIIIIMDSDHQDNPTAIPMLIAASPGYDVVFTVSKEKSQSSFRRLGSSIYRLTFDLMADFPHPYLSKNLSSMVLIRRNVADCFQRVKDVRQNYLLTILWMGFRSNFLDVKRQTRISGRTSYSIARLIRLGIDGLVFHSNKPLFAIGIAGLLILGFGGYLSIQAISHPADSEQRLLRATLFLCTGFVVSALGILGIYLGLFFEQVKQRPVYCISDSTVGHSRST